MWTFSIYPSGSIPRRSWSLNLVIPSYPRSSTRGRVIGGYCLHSIIILMISFIKSSLVSDFLTMSLMVFGPLTPSSGVSILILLTPEPLVLGRIYLDLLSVSLILSIFIRLWNLLSSFIFTYSEIYFALYLIYVALIVELFFLLIRYSLSGFYF